MFSFAECFCLLFLSSGVRGADPCWLHLLLRGGAAGGAQASLKGPWVETNYLQSLPADPFSPLKWSVLLAREKSGLLLPSVRREAGERGWLDPHACSSASSIATVLPFARLRQWLRQLPALRVLGGKQGCLTMTCSQIALK